MAVAPALDEMVLERLELVPVSAERLLLVFNLRSGVVRTIFVEVPARVARRRRCRRSPGSSTSGSAGHTLQADPRHAARAAARRGRRGRRSGAAQHLHRRGRGDLRPVGRARARWCWGARRCWRSSRSSPPTRGCASCSGSPRGATCSSRRSHRRRQTGLSITIGAENPDARLTDFTLVTASYEAGGLKGVIGVMGPTRMPYDKIIGLVEHTSRLVEDLLE